MGGLVLFRLGTVAVCGFGTLALRAALCSHIKPAAAEAGIAIKGWHTRHSYTTLLRQNNNDPKVVQGLLRHKPIRVTMDIYDEAISAERQMAHHKVLRLVTRKQDRTVMRTASEKGVAASA